MNVRSVFLLLMVSLPLAACGVKGPLYLPPSDAVMEDLPEPPVDEGPGEDADEGLDAEDDAVLDDFDVDEDESDSEEPGRR